MLTEADVLEALCACFDPDTRLNIIEAGLVDGMQLRVDMEAPGAGIEGVPVRQKLTVRMMKAADDVQKQDMVRGQVLNLLAGVEGLSVVDVEWVPGWSVARISAAGRRKLGLDAGPFRVLNNRVR